MKTPGLGFSRDNIPDMPASGYAALRKAAETELVPSRRLILLYPSGKPPNHLRVSPAKTNSYLRRLSLAISAR